MAKASPKPAAPAAGATPAPDAQVQELKTLIADAESSAGDIEVEVTDEEVLNGMSDSDLERLSKLASLAEARKKAAAEGLTAEDKALVRVYNRGRRRFDHLPYQSQPGAFVTVPRWLAKQWLRDYPGDFVAGDEALKTIDASAAALQDANAKIKQLEADLAAAKTSK